MKSVTIQCDRCSNVINGIETPEFTGGFYKVKTGGCWDFLAKNDESILCDTCVHSDEKYKKQYGIP